MRQYLLDEISRADVKRVRDYLNDHALPSSLEDIWWIELQDDLLNATQYSHRQCKPYQFAIELGDNFVRFEFLIRSQQTMRCSCIGFANRQQRDFIMAFADRMVAELDLKT